MFGKFSLFNKGRSQHGLEDVSGEGLQQCPSCGDEYRAEFARCAVCNVDLVQAIEDTTCESPVDKIKQNRDLHISAHDKLVTMRSGSLMEMKTIQHLLKKDTIGSLLVEDRSNSSKGCCKVFELRVKEQEAGEAQQILIDDFKRSTAFDSHDFNEDAEAVFDQRVTEARCPACGCQFITTDRACPECGLCF